MKHNSAKVIFWFGFVYLGDVMDSVVDFKSFALYFEEKFKPLDRLEAYIERPNQLTPVQEVNTINAVENVKDSRNRAISECGKLTINKNAYKQKRKSVIGNQVKKFSFIQKFKAKCGKKEIKTNFQKHSNLASVFWQRYVHQQLYRNFKYRKKLLQIHLSWFFWL